MKGGWRGAKETISNRVGIWVAFEWQNKLLYGLGTWSMRRFEAAEVARQRTLVGQLPAAKVATVIATYKRPSLLVEAVKSALGQELEDQIVLVVDDGGGQVPDLPDDPRLHVVYLSRNTGNVGVVRNIGIKLTNSVYLAFLDDDNRWEPNHLSVTVNALDQGPGLVYTRIERHRRDGSVLDYVGQPFADRHVIAGSRIAHFDLNAIVVRRSPKVVFSRLRRPKLLLPREDWEFLYRLSRSTEVRYVDQSTVRYLINDESYYTPIFGSQPDRSWRARRAADRAARQSTAL